MDDINATVKTYTPRKGFYTVAQVAKFVRPGAQRIDMSGASVPLTVLAFYNTNNGQFTLTGVNTNSSPTTLSGTLTNLPAMGSLELYYTDSTNNLFDGGAVPVTNGSFSVSVPADCVFTLATTNPPSPPRPPPSGTVTINGSQTYQVIDGFGVNANHRSWTNTELQPVLDALIDQAGMTLFRVVFDKADWEATNDNSDPSVMNWDYYSQVYSSLEFQKMWDMAAYLNQKGRAGGLMFNFQGIGPGWMGGDTSLLAMRPTPQPSIRSPILPYARHMTQAQETPLHARRMIQNIMHRHGGVYSARVLPYGKGHEMVRAVLWLADRSGYPRRFDTVRQAGLQGKKKHS